MTKKVLVIGHSDADGHVIAEQTRRNLALIHSFDVSVLVDPKRTYGHKSWLKIDSLKEIDNADIIVFVDLMFSPATFLPEFQSLKSFADQHSNKLFIIIDHHPLPLARMASSSNLRAVYRPDVFECTVGPKSGMMILAAIDEKQPHTIAPFRKPLHDTLTKGLKRAAAVGSDLPGEALMALLRSNRWDTLYALGQEESAAHRLVRGRRVSSDVKSPALIAATEIAKGVINQNLIQNKQTFHNATRESQIMPYDITLERYYFSDEPKRYHNAPVQTRDLETLVTLLEVAAISLTIEPDITFTRDELIAEAKSLCGEGVIFDESDVNVVLEKASFVTWSGGGLRLR